MWKALWKTDLEATREWKTLKSVVRFRIGHLFLAAGMFSAYFIATSYFKRRIEKANKRLSPVTKRHVG